MIADVQQRPLEIAVIGLVERLIECRRMGIVLFLVFAAVGCDGRTVVGDNNLRSVRAVDMLWSRNSAGLR